MKTIDLHEKLDLNMLRSLQRVVGFGWEDDKGCRYSRHYST